MSAVLAAQTVTVGTLPASEYADTEVSTNFPFSVLFEQKNQIEVTLALDTTPTNNVEVALGTDADGDGNLSPEETTGSMSRLPATVFVWRFGSIGVEML